jgi:hypothetical protein
VRQRDEIRKLTSKEEGSFLTYLGQEIDPDGYQGRWVTVQHRVSRDRVFGRWAPRLLSTFRPVPNGGLTFVRDSAAEVALTQRAADVLGVPYRDVRLRAGAPIYDTQRYRVALGALCVATLVAIIAVADMLDLFGQSDRTRLLLPTSSLLLLVVFGVAVVQRDAASKPLLQAAAILLPLSAAIAYAVTRAMYYEYLFSFGVTPESVGYGYQTIIAYQFFYILGRGIAVTGILFAGYGTYVFLSKRKDDTERALVAILAALATLAILLILLGKDLSVAYSRGKEVAADHPVSADVNDLFVYPDVRRARLQTLAGATPQSRQIDMLSNHIYLGTVAGQVVVYDADAQAADFLPQVAYRVALYAADRTVVIGADCRLSPSRVTVHSETGTTVAFISQTPSDLRLNSSKLKGPILLKAGGSDLAVFEPLQGTPRSVNVTCTADGRKVLAGSVVTG